MDGKEVRKGDKGCEDSGEGQPTKSRTPNKKKTEENNEANR